MSRIQTYSDQLFDFGDVNPETINLTDIVHALSGLPRFTAQTVHVYTVGQHSIEVSKIYADLTGHQDPEGEMLALLHDAHEAYTNDLSGPAKEHNPGYCAFEDSIESWVKFVFALPEKEEAPERYKVLKQADLMALSTEYLQLFRAHPWTPPYPSLNYSCGLEDREVIRQKFLDHFFEVASRIENEGLRALYLGQHQSVRF